MSVEKPPADPTTDDVVRSIREGIRLEQQKSAEPRDGSPLRRLSEEIGQLTRRLWGQRRT